MIVYHGSSADNCLSLLKGIPVTASIVKRVEEKLGEAIPEEAKVEGIPFRKYLANRLTGNIGPVKKMTAKRKDLAPTIRSDWGMIIVDVLKFCLMQKYEQSEAFREELERSRELYIVEVQNNSRKPADTYSAKLSPDGKTWSGPNLMGRLLMELRDNSKLEWHLPDDAMDFSDLKA